LNKKILLAIQDALIFVEAGEWQQEEHGEVEPEDHQLASDWVTERLSAQKLKNQGSD